MILRNKRYFGHLVGDKVLKEVGHIILNNTRRADLPFRWGW